MTPTSIVFLRAWVEARLGSGERGAGLVEYVLLVMGIAILVMAALAFFGNKVGSKYSSTGADLPF